MRKLLSILFFPAALLAQSVATPVISPAPGSFSGSVIVSITDATPGAAIFYTTDGSTPNTASPRYTGPFQIVATTAQVKKLVQAIAILQPSQVAAANFTVNVPVAPPPTKFNYVLGSSVGQFFFSWKIGAAAPASQTTYIWDSSPCPPPAGVPTCHWPVVVSTDQPWLVAGPNGSTGFTLAASINTSALTQAGTFTGHISLTQSQFKNPTITIPVTITVVAAPVPPPPPPPKHNVTLTWLESSPATQFNVYRSNTSGSGYGKVASTPSLTFTDVAVPFSSTLFYVVTAVDSSNNESGFSSEVTAAIPAN